MTLATAEEIAAAAVRLIGCRYTHRESIRQLVNRHRAQTGQQNATPPRSGWMTVVSISINREIGILERNDP